MQIRMLFKLKEVQNLEQFQILECEKFISDQKEAFRI